MKRRMPARILDRELFARFKGVNRFVLGPMILEYSMDIAHERDQIDVAQKKNHLEHAVQDVEERTGRGDPDTRTRSDEPSRKVRKRDKESHPKNERCRDRREDGPSREL